MNNNCPESWKCVIPLSEIGNKGIPWEGGWKLSAKDEIPFWGQRFAIPGELAVNATAMREEKGFLVTLSLQFSVQALCSRCLSSTTLAIDEVFRYFYMSWQEETEQDGSSGDGQVVVVRHFGPALNVTQEIWESLILSLPSVVLCSDDCKGLCPSCGKNLNEGPCSCSQNVQDPRLDKLRELRLGEDSDGDSGEGGN